MAATMRSMRVVLLAALAAATGCGYSSKSLHPDGIDTVYVEMFQSKEFRRGLEMQLTEALRKTIDEYTPYRNAPRNKADTLVSGEVVDVRLGTLGKSFATDLPRQQAATIVVRYRWKDLRNGRMIRERDQIVQTVEYVPPVGETFFQASEEGMNKLARRIVDDMETGW